MSRLNLHHMNTVEPVAVIGMSCRLPGGVETPDQFWRLLCDGVDPISDVPADRWNLETIFSADRGQKGKSYTRQAGFVSNFDQFDAPFFGISRREAECMDPQQRWLLEAAWEAFESAGLPPESLAGTRTGVFIGLFVRDYETLQLSSVNRDTIDMHTGVGVSMGIAANRISYAYNLVGPSLTLDTACSSAMVAIHLACQSIRNGECEVALAGGVNALLRAEMTVATSKASMLSPDARSKSFDASANGYVRSEGVGLIVLKPLSKAIADGDPVVAVLRGSAVNQDGRSNGLTVPSGRAQEIALRSALEAANTSHLDVQYAEAHGTGTPVGDPIEANAIGNVLGRGRPEGDRLVLGSVKSNIGHTESAAGVVSLLKVALALQHRQIPPNLHFNNPNPAIPFDELSLHVPTSITPWPEPANGRRMAIINSFGFGGTNGTLVVEEAPAREVPPPTETNGRSFLLPLSARSEEALRAVAERLLEFNRTASAHVPDICRSASLHRGQLNHRATLVCDSKDSLNSELESFLAGEVRPGTATGEATEPAPQPVFVFSGMGPQWWGMGRQLFHEEPVFRQAVERCDAIFEQLSGWSILAELTADEKASKIDQTRIAQPCIFALQAGLAALWQSWGIKPSAVVGHSVGEAAAAYVAGALTLEDAVRVIYNRSRLQQTTAGTGTMLAVGLTREAAEREIEAHAGLVSIAAINSPRAITLAGDTEALRIIGQRLAERGQFQRFLQVEVPYHSPKMDPIQAEMLSSLESLNPRNASVPLFSTVTGGIIDGITLNAEYWWKNVRYPVFLADAIGAIAQLGHRTFLEIGPHPVLKRNIDECLVAGQIDGKVFSSLKRNEAERATLLASAGDLFCAGVRLDWAAFTPGHFIPLPPYPWQRERYWLETTDSTEQRIGNPARRAAIAQGAEEHPLLGGRLRLAPSVIAWQSEIDLQRFSYLNDHRIQNTVVYPGAGYCEMAMAAAQVDCIENLTFRNALFLDEQPAQLQFSLTGDEFHIHSVRDDVWTLHATGRAQTQPDEAQAQPTEAADFRKAMSTPAERLTQAEVYDRFARLGLRYGPAFQAIQHLDIREGEAYSHLTSTTDTRGYKFHPTISDACFQTLIGTDLLSNRRGVYLPTGIDRIRISGTIDTSAELECFARLRSRTETEIVGDIDLFQNGVLLFQVRGLRCLFQPEQRQEQPFDQFLYANRWDPMDVAPLRTSAADIHVLIIGNGAGLAKQISDLVRAEGGTAVVAEPSAIGDLQLLLSSNPVPGHVVHIASLDSDEATEGSLQVLELLRAMQDHAQRLWLVTRGAQSIAGEPLNIAQSAVWGLARVIAQERPELRCARLDLEADAPLLPGVILDEIRRDGPEDQIAWRAGRRHVLRLARFSPKTAVRKSTIDPAGTYLITGGTGGLGIVFARHLLARGARHLVLTSRSGGTGKEALLADLRRDGADVRAMAADIGDEAAVQHLMADISREMPPLRGVIHGAAVIDDGILSQQTAERFHSVWHPKARGAWLLHQELQDQSLDFFVLFSSVASLTGSAGQGIYSAANAYLDALAHHRHSQGQPALSINWGPWAQVGVASERDILARLADRGLSGLDPADGIAAFDDLLGQDIAQTGVCVFQWKQFFQNFPGAGSPFFSAIAASEAQTAASSTSDSFHVRLFQMSEEERDPAIRRHLSDELARALRLRSGDQVKPRQRLFDLGMDSLTTVELSSRLQVDLGVRIPSTVMFDFPTVGALGDYLVESVTSRKVSDRGAQPEASRPSPDDFETLDQRDVVSLLRAALVMGEERYQ